MTANHDAYDDPMLTAYALGELDDDAFATERAAIEARLDTDPEARRIVDEIRNSAAWLERELQAETDDGLTEDQRSALFERGAANADRAGALRTLQRVAVAAGIVGIVAAGTYVVLDREGRGVDRRVAAKPDPARVEHGLEVVEETLIEHDADDDADVIFEVHDRLRETPREDRLAKRNELAKNPPVAKPLGTETAAARTRFALDGGAGGAGAKKAGEKKTSGEKVVDKPADAAPRLKDVIVGAVTRNKPTPVAPYTGPAGRVPPNNQPGGSLKPPPAPEPTAGPAPTLSPSPVADPNAPTQSSDSTDSFFGRKVPLRADENVDEVRKYADEKQSRAGFAYDRRAGGRTNTESYGYIVENPFKRPTDEPLSTFSIDVDTASYANARRFLNQGAIPPKGALRIEEFLNYFRYNYPHPVDGRPFSVNVETASCPWAPAHRIARIGIKGREVPKAMRPASNFVFLLDVSGSMRDPNKLPLVKQAMRLLVEQFDEGDRVAIVTYAGQSGIALPSTPCNEKARVIAAIDALRAGGSTNGAAGIRSAYDLIAKNFIRGGNNRVLLCTDGDFNVGVSSNDELIALIREQAKGGAFLSILGFGSGNYKDDKLEGIAQHGNGNYHYLDSLAEAKKVLVDELAGTLITIAKDVKIQVEFNPGKVSGYRLLGYENRTMAARDFNDDTKDAGEIGAGHTVTALYEIVPAGVEWARPGVDPLKYQKPRAAARAAVASPELMTVKLRYKLPESDASTRFDVPVTDTGLGFAQASHDTQFAVSVAAFCMVLRDSAFRGNASLAQVLELAMVGLSNDPKGRRAEFVDLVRRAQQIKR